MAERIFSRPRIAIPDGGGVWGSPFTALQIEADVLRLQVTYIGYSFSGIDASLPKVQARFGLFSAAIGSGDITAVTEGKTDQADGLTGATVSHTATAESGSPTEVEYIDLDPTGGFFRQEPLSNGWIIPASGVWRFQIAADDANDLTLTVRYIPL